MVLKVFDYDLGEVWKLNSSPHNPDSILACFSKQKPGTAQIISQTSLLTLPQDDSLEEKSGEFLKFSKIEILDTEIHGNEVKTTEFHPTDEKTLATVVDSKIVIFDRITGQSRVAAELTGKNPTNFTTGKWSQHHQGNQFIACQDTCVKSYDIREQNLCAWQIQDAHGQLVRDLDCNPNKQCHFVTGGDDSSLKVWDSRMLGNKPVFSRTDHSHWIWSVRFNTFHDQLILSSSSDCKVLLTCAGSVSSEIQSDSCDDSEGQTKGKIADGLLQTFDQHEDSVYCVEWSNVDPWVFASLSYDGRLTISRVPKQFKYQILF